MGANKVGLILDTDIGTDVDDALALALALRSPEIDLRAITTVHGDVDLRARMAAKLMRMAGIKGVPIGKGLREPLLRSRPIHWLGHEGKGLLGPEDTTLSDNLGHAVDLIITTVLANAGEITLVPIGPLTNVAAAIIREPRIATTLKEIVLMGGVARVGANASILPWVEHNIGLDPEAAQVVFGSGIPITMIGLDVTTQVAMRRHQIDQISSRGTLLTSALADQLNRYLCIRDRDWTYLHDPLALAVAFDRSLVELRPFRVDIETRGEFTTGSTVAVTGGLARRPVNAQVAVAVDAPRFVRLFLDRICS